MVVKKKKITAKKPVKKVEKKMAKPKNVKKSATKPAKKVISTSAKKPVAKLSNAKPPKLAHMTKTEKSVKTAKPVKASAQKQSTVSIHKKATSVKKIAPAKTHKPQKTRTTEPRKVQHAMSKQQTMREYTKLRNVHRPMIEDRDIVEKIDITPSKKATTLLGALEFTPYQAKEGEVYMSERQREHFRKILDAWKQQLMQDVDLTVGHLKEDAVFYADPVDRASQEEGFNLELRTRDRERRLIKKIEQSLDLITNGEYGFCEDCGAEIGVRRLEARPTAVKCIDCKTFQEIREKQLGGG